MYLEVVADDERLLLASQIGGELGDSVVDQPSGSG